jgi:tetratricopeptide (TPR) repeat protein
MPHTPPDSPIKPTSRDAAPRPWALVPRESALPDSLSEAEVQSINSDLAQGCHIASDWFQTFKNQAPRIIRLESTVDTVISHRGAVMKSVYFPCILLLALIPFLLIPFFLNTPCCRADNGPINQLDQLDQAVNLINEKKWPEAAEAWGKVAAMNPQLGRAWNNLARAHFQAGNYRKAIPAYAKMVELRSGYPFNAAYNVACCHARLGEKDQALEWLQKALDLGFRSLRQIREDDDLSSLRGDPRFQKMVASVDVTKLDRVEGWRFDLDLLVREIKRCHYAPFRKVTREQFDIAANKLRADIPGLSDNQIAAGLQKLLCMVGDGHSSFANGGERENRAKDGIPAKFYFFAEGLFLTDVDPRFKDLVGAEVLRINGHSVSEVLKALDQYVAQDNSQGLLWRAPEYLRMPSVLNGLGLIPDEKVLPLTIKDVAGKERDVTFPADSGDPEKTWISVRRDAAEAVPLYLKNVRKAYWFEYLPADKLVYFQYNSVTDEGNETFEKFCTRLFQFITDHDVDRLVIDLRWNGGGNNFLNKPLIHGLIRCDKINQSRKLFVVIGRNTFSAAMCGAVQIERETKAIFVGEPTGSSPNFVGESAVIVDLSYSKLRASISDLYWQNSVAMDYRTWIAPSINTPPTFAAYRVNRDPALEAIFALK